MFGFQLQVQLDHSIGHPKRPRYGSPSLEAPSASLFCKPQQEFPRPLEIYNLHTHFSSGLNCMTGQVDGYIEFKEEVSNSQQCRKGPSNFLSVTSVKVKRRFTSLWIYL